MLSVRNVTDSSAIQTIPITRGLYANSHAKERATAGIPATDFVRNHVAGVRSGIEASISLADTRAMLDGGISALRRTGC